MSEASQQPMQESQVPSPESPPPSQEVAESPESPQESAEASPESQAASPEESGDEAAPSAPDKGHKRAGGFQRRIDKLQRQNEQLMEMLAQYGGRAPQPQQPQAPAQPRTPEQEFQALMRQEAQAAFAQERAQVEQQQRHAELQKSMEESRARHADFDDALADVAHIPLPPHVHEAILRSEAKGEIIYALSKNRAVLERIRSVSPLEAALEIGRLEAKSASGATQQTPRKPAPAPISPVTARGASNVKPVDQMSYEEYKTWHSGRAKR